jgi:hypothetical protein
MTDTPDYLERLGATVRANETGCGISHKRQGGAYPTGGWFPEVRIAELRSSFNQAMHVAVAYYTECVAKAGVKLTPAQIMEVSFRVVVSALAARWALLRRLYFEIADLRTARAEHSCWIYCEMKFGAHYVHYAGALMDMSLEQFRQYERKYRG